MEPPTEKPTEEPTTEPATEPANEAPTNGTEENPTEPQNEDGKDQTDDSGIPWYIVALIVLVCVGIGIVITLLIIKKKTTGIQLGELCAVLTKKLKRTTYRIGENICKPYS